MHRAGATALGLRNHAHALVLVDCLNIVADVRYLIERYSVSGYAAPYHAAAAVVFFSHLKLLYRTLKLVNVAIYRAHCYDRQKETKERISIRFIAIVVIITTAVRRMRMIPGFIPLALPFFELLLLVTVLLFPEVGTKSPKNGASKRADFVATANLIADETARDDTESRGGDITIALQYFFSLCSH